MPVTGAARPKIHLTYDRMGVELAYSVGPLAPFVCSD
jgi:hypothetical protein